MADFWVMFAEPQVDGISSVDAVPSDIELNDWLSGKPVKFDDSSVVPITVKDGSGDHRGDIFNGIAPLFHIDCIELFEKFGVEPMQSQRVEIVDSNHPEDEHKDDYRLLNVPNLVQCIIGYDINTPPHFGPEEFEIDAKAVEGLHIFRPAECPAMIIVSNALKIFLEEQEIVAVSFVLTRDYFKTSNLTIDELKSSKNLAELVEKMRYSSETFEEVEALLKQGANPNYVDTSDWSAKPPLFKACDQRKKEERKSMLELLIKWGADVDRAYDDYYPIYRAAGTEDRDVVQYLIEQGATRGYEKALEQAIEDDCLEIVKLLVDNGVDINDPSGLTHCTETHRLKYKEGMEEYSPGLDIAKYLIQRGADIDGEHQEYNNPLYWAVAKNALDLTKLFMTHGADIKTLNLDLLKGANTPEMIDLLVSLGVDPLAKVGESNQTYLMDCLFWGEKEKFDAFLKHGIDLYEADDEGLLPFHYALRSEKKNLIVYLLSLYDIKKVNEIKSVMGIAENPAITKVLKQAFEDSELSDDERNLRKVVDFASNSASSKLQISQPYEESKTFSALKHNLEKCRSEIKEKNESAFNSLPEFNLINTQEITEIIYNEFKENISQWQASLSPDWIDKPKAFVMEYAGFYTNPFDGSGMFYGYQMCEGENSSWHLDGAINELNEAPVSLHYLFDSIEELVNDYGELITELGEYYRTMVFMTVHTVIDKLVKEGAFNVLPVERPFYILGREHDEDPTLIYKVD
jgi:ankyrin repeat protein